MSNNHREHRGWSSHLINFIASTHRIFGYLLSSLIISTWPAGNHSIATPKWISGVGWWRFGFKCDDWNTQTASNGNNHYGVYFMSLADMIVHCLRSWPSSWKMSFVRTGKSIIIYTWILLHLGQEQGLLCRKLHVLHSRRSCIVFKELLKIGISQK